MTDTTQPIEVHATPIPDQLWAALRQIAPPVIAFAVGRHWIADDLAAVLSAVIGIVAPIVIGQIKTRKRAVQLTTVAQAAPDNVAVVKP